MDVFYDITILSLTPLYLWYVIKLVWRRMARKQRIPHRVWTVGPTCSCQLYSGCSSRWLSLPQWQWCHQTRWKVWGLEHVHVHVSWRHTDAPVGVLFLSIRNLRWYTSNKYINFKRHSLEVNIQLGVFLVVVIFATRMSHLSSKNITVGIHDQTVACNKV